MKYDKNDRQAIKQLSNPALALFEVIEREEKGEIVDVGGLCSALMESPKFVVFSCLSGNGEREELGQDLGVLFTTKLRTKAEGFMKSLTGAGFTGKLSVIVDDTEPVMFWNWQKSQSEVTTWCQMVVEDEDIPDGWEVKLWSDLEIEYRSINHDSKASSYECFYSSRSSEITRSVIYHRLLQHIKTFPNSGLQLKKVSAEKATLDKLIQYEFQRLVLNRLLTNAILIQTETPWEIKDPLFHGSLGNSFSSIIHPFEARR